MRRRFRLDLFSSEQSETRMSTRVAIVTGANKGIGLAVTKELSTLFDGVIYLTSRDIRRGNEALDQLKKVGDRQKTCFRYCTNIHYYAITLL